MKHYRLDGTRPVEENDFSAWALWYETANRRVAFTQAGAVSVSTVFVGFVAFDGYDDVASFVDALAAGAVGAVGADALAATSALDGEDALPPLFETKIFGGPRDGQIRRYRTWEEAERGHVEIVERERGAAHFADAR